MIDDDQTMSDGAAAKQERSHTLGVQIVNLWNFTTTNKICLIILILWIFLKLITQPFCSSISY